MKNRIVAYSPPRTHLVTLSVILLVNYMERRKIKKPLPTLEENQFNISKKKTEVHKTRNFVSSLITRFQPWKQNTLVKQLEKLQANFQVLTVTKIQSIFSQFI